MNEEELMNNLVIQKFRNEWLYGENGMISSVKPDEYQCPAIYCEWINDICDNTERNCSKCDVYVGDRINESRIYVLDNFPILYRKIGEIIAYENKSSSVLQFNSFDDACKTFIGYAEEWEKFNDLPNNILEKFAHWNEFKNYYLKMYNFVEYYYARSCPLVVVCEDCCFIFSELVLVE